MKALRYNALRYAKRLIEFDSTSHRSNKKISKYLHTKLLKLGFAVEKVQYRDARDVRKVNLVAKKGDGAGGLAYFSHNDVVPAKKWFTEDSTPFEPVVADGRLYGRGSCDMKGSIAAMLDAAERFDAGQLKRPLYFVITADEEVGFHGAKVVVKESELYREMVAGGTKAIIGEPTELEVVHAHKGSLKLVAKSYGQAAHSSTAEGQNANLAMIPFLQEMKAIADATDCEAKWQNDLFDPPTLSPNIIIKDNSRAMNIKPDKSTCTAYFRTMPDVNIQPLLDRAKDCAEQNGLEICFEQFGEPFFVNADSEFVVESLTIAGRERAHTVSYGTDGGMLGELEDKIVFGPGSIRQAHTSEEWISLEQLELGTDLYEQMIRRWCCEQ